MSALEDEIIFLTKACQLEQALFHRHVFALYRKLPIKLGLSNKLCVFTFSI